MTAPERESFPPPIVRMDAYGGGGNKRGVALVGWVRLARLRWACIPQHPSVVQGVLTLHHHVSSGVPT